MAPLDLLLRGGSLHRRRVEGDSDLEGSTKERIDLAAAELDSQKLTGISVDPTLGKSTFYFDLGSRLETFPYEPDTEQWLLHEPSGWVLTYRSDGYYSHQPGNTPPARKMWHPLFKEQDERVRTQPPIRTYFLRSRRRLP